MRTLRTLSAVVLALLVLVSSTSFLIGFHFCAGEVQQIALFTKAEKCEKEQLPPCHRQMKTSCCTDSMFYHESDDFKASVDHVQIVAPVPSDIEQPLVLIAEIIPSAPLSRIHYHAYDPPLQTHNLTVVHRVFLI